MLSLPKTATLAVISLTLLTAVGFSDAGFAWQNSSDDSKFSTETIQIDPAVLDAQDAARAEQMARFEKKSDNNGTDVVFTAGTGDFKNPMPQQGSESLSDPVSAETPEKLSANSLSELVQKYGAPGALDKETHCLAGAVYFESKGEELPGQLAVARVVMARAKSGRFAPTICGVVFQKSQFSFVRGGKMPAIDKNSRNWRNAVAISKIALADAWKSPVEGALFFHATYVSPGWRLKRIGTVDNHVFYR